MRSTRASTAWAGVALATSFLSVAIIGVQPHTTATNAVAQSVVAPSDNSSLIVKPVDVAERGNLTSMRQANDQPYGVDRDSH